MKWLFIFERLSIRMVDAIFKVRRTGLAVEQGVGWVGKTTRTNYLFSAFEAQSRRLRLPEVNKLSGLAMRCLDRW